MYEKSALGILLLGYFLYLYVPRVDPLNHFSEQSSLTDTDLVFVSFGFCLNFPLVNHLSQINNATSNTPENEYAKQSIYSLFYSIYRLIGETESENGIPYEFTFNTWGIDGDFFPKDDPQRMGKEAYRRLTDFPVVREAMDQKGFLNILEVGCGTGAGANLTSYLHPNSHYVALDMQKQAIDTCNRLHAHEAEKGIRGKLQCVQANGMNLPFPPNSFDQIIISETHIAEHGWLTPEDYQILDEIERVLKPGGLFSWGNALVSPVWRIIENYFHTHTDWEVVVVNDVTEDAVRARENDYDRVEKYLNDIDDLLWPTTYFSKCNSVLHHLILDFYRHPGTRLFNNMVIERDSYKQACFRLNN